MSRLAPGRLLVPVDLSASSRAGLRVAGDVARRFGAEIHVLHVEVATASLVEVLNAFRTAADPDAAARAHLEGVQRRVEAFVTETLGQAHGAVVEVVEGLFVAEAILRTAREREVDWICMSATGQTGWRHLVMGSTTAEVVLHAPLPVLTMRGRTDEADDFVFDDFRQVLVAVDLGEGCETLVETGAALATPGGALTLLHVIEVPTEVGLYGVPLSLPAESLEAARQWTEGALAKLTSDVNPRILEPPRIVAGRPTAQILAAERELQPDLTVVGTHGRHGIDRLMLGSVADRVVRHATGPVLVVPTGPRRTP